MADYDSKRKLYAERVKKQEEGISNLLTVAKNYSGLFEPGVIRQLELFQLRCNQLYHKLDKNEFEIAIVGLEKAGKSTFGNALMQNTILPVADERCTYSISCVRYGSDHAVVRFFNNEEMDQILRSYLGVLGVESVESYTYQDFTRVEYGALYSKIDQRLQGCYVHTVNQDILNLLDCKDEILNRYIGKPDKTFQGEELSSEEFRQYITNPKVAVAVKEVCIESSKLSRMQNAVIYDVPGFDSPITSMYFEQTQKRMKDADAIVLITSADRPSFTAPILESFNNTLDEDNVLLSDKLFVFGNRADIAYKLAPNIETLKNEVDKWHLLNRSVINDRLIIGSAKAHLQAHGIVDGESCIRRIEEPDYRSACQHGDGIDYVYQKLNEYNENERFFVLQLKIRHNSEKICELLDGMEEKHRVDDAAVLSAIFELKRECTNFEAEI